jgi:hypothetical protein
VLRQDIADARLEPLQSVEAQGAVVREKRLGYRRGEPGRIARSMALPHASPDR